MKRKRNVKASKRVLYFGGCYRVSQKKVCTFRGLGNIKYAANIRNLNVNLSVKG